MLEERDLAWICNEDVDNLMVELNQDIAWSGMRVHSYGSMNIELVLFSRSTSYNASLSSMFWLS